MLLVTVCLHVPLHVYTGKEIVKFTLSSVGIRQERGS